MTTDAVQQLEDGAIQAKLKAARVARLATTDREGRPHIVPVCFAYGHHRFYTPLDLKPKRTSPEKLARVRHIRARPSVALLIDEYQENWERLWYILVRGTAALVYKHDGAEHGEAHRLLRAKYPQYAAGLLPEQAPVIRILPMHVIIWGKL